MKAWYQEAVINGVRMPAQRRRDTSEKRWSSFINPWIPTNGDGRVFLEFGCAEGYYCRRASELGYKAYGIEIDDDYVEHAKYWEEKDPRGVSILHCNINLLRDITACHTALLANVHYWLTQEELENLILLLDDKALNVIVVSRNKPHSSHKSPVDHKFLDVAFCNFQQKSRIHGDKFFSMLFKNTKLMELEVDALFSEQPFCTSRMFLPSFRRFIHDEHDTTFPAYLKRRGWKDWRGDPRVYRDQIDEMKQSMNVFEPLKVRLDDMHLVDGNHRLIIAKELGIRRVICEWV